MIDRILFDWNDIEFANPEYLYLLVILPLLAIYLIAFRKKSIPALKISSFENLGGISPTLKIKALPILKVFRLLAIGLIIIGLARPQSTSSRKNITTDGIDIVISFDISTSMLAEDLKPNRLEAAKETALEFIQNRPDDRIGLVVFAGESFTQCPLTIDHEALKNLFLDVKTGMVEDGTAIGSGLATAVTRLKESKAKSKVIILLTDGVNNMGFISPETAADIAYTYGIRVYTIGVGTKGQARFPVQTAYGTRYVMDDVKIDEELLQSIAKLTGGQYFRATNNKGLQDVYKQIDEMEKTKTDVAYFSKKTEEFLPFALLGFLFIALEFLLSTVYFKTLE